MNKEIECETCIKRKTMYCPNSSECMSTEDKPYYQNRIMLLEENEKLNHYKLLYQKVKVRNDLGLKKIQELKENAKSEITTLTTGDKAYYKYVNNIFKELEDILKGNNEE